MYFYSYSKSEYYLNFELFWFMEFWAFKKIAVI